MSVVLSLRGPAPEVPIQEQGCFLVSEIVTRTSDDL